MRLAKRNKQKLWYALLKGSRYIFELDENGNKIVDFVDEDGNVYYRQTGERELTYHEPVPFESNISFGGGEAQTYEYGIDMSAYDATIIYLRDELPITETSLVWFETEPVFNADGEVEPKSADYKVVKIKPSLNMTKALLEKISKNDEQDITS